jgi:hypothetical protein
MAQIDHAIVLKRVFGVSSRYEGKLYAAAEGSGYQPAVRRLRRLDDEIAQLTAKAFECQPETSKGIAAQAAALLTSLSVVPAWRLQENSGFAKQLAMNAIRVISGTEEART